MADEYEPQVSFGVKELLQEIRDSVRGLDAKLDTKADRSEVSNHEARISNVEVDVRIIKEQRIQGTDFRRWLIPLLVAVVISAPGWLQAVGVK